MGHATGFDPQILMCYGPLNMSCYGLNCQHWHQKKKAESAVFSQVCRNNAPQIIEQKQIHCHQCCGSASSTAMHYLLHAWEKYLTLLPPHKQQCLRMVVTESIWTDTACIGMPSADYLLTATQDCVVGQSGVRSCTYHVTGHLPL